MVASSCQCMQTAVPHCAAPQTWSIADAVRGRDPAIALPGKEHKEGPRVVNFQQAVLKRAQACVAGVFRGEAPPQVHGHHTHLPAHRRTPASRGMAHTRAAPAHTPCTIQQSNKPANQQSNKPASKPTRHKGTADRFVATLSRGGGEWKGFTPARPGRTHAPAAPCTRC
jgi:hypothetical protein